MNRSEIHKSIDLLAESLEDKRNGFDNLSQSKLDEIDSILSKRQPEMSQDALVELLSEIRGNIIKDFARILRKTKEDRDIFMLLAYFSTTEVVMTNFSEQLERLAKFQSRDNENNHRENT